MLKSTNEHQREKRDALQRLFTAAGNCSGTLMFTSLCSDKDFDFDSMK